MKKMGRFTNMESNTLLTSQWIKEGIKREIKRYLEINKNGNEHSKTYGTPQKQF